VIRFAGSGLKIPHIGWNTLSGAKGPIYRGLPGNPYFYFVHSYFPVPARSEIVSASCEYGGSFAASVSTGSLHATQFHPEKSQAAGLTLLRNFLVSLD
jgi:glutamine amidotransferase